MREISYLSPSAIDQWEKSQDEFYLKYLAGEKPPRFPQNKAMAAGSVFDAHCKSYLHERLFGKGNDPKYALESLIEAQVESHLRDWAREHGPHIFEQYQSSGALADLFTELSVAQGDIKMEMEVRGAVEGHREGATRTIGSVVLLGKPDLTFTNKAGAFVVYDWKVSGHQSNNAPSPMQGYLRLRSSGKTSHGMHKKCVPMMVKGVMINIGGHLEEYSKDWARQLSIYGWLCQQPIGSDFIVGIDQICCDKNKGLAPERPSIRVAEHRTTVGREFQSLVFNRAVEIWEIVHSDHIFRDLSKEDSAAKCEVMEQVAAGLVGDGTTEDKWFSDVCRTQAAW